MPDITMCTGGSPLDGDLDLRPDAHCPLRATCYRFMATPNPYRQAFADFTQSEANIDYESVIPIGARGGCKHKMEMRK